ASACQTVEARVGVLLELAEVYRDRLRQDGSTTTVLNKALQLAPDHLAVLDQLANHYERLKRWSDVAVTLTKKISYVKTAAERAAVHLQLGRLYVEKLVSQAESIRAFESVIELDPDNTEAIGHLRNAYEKRREWDKLIALEKRAIERIEDPGERLRRSILFAK